MEQANVLLRVSHEKRTEMNTTYTLPFPGYRIETLLRLPIWEINKKVKETLQTPSRQPFYHLLDFGG